MCVSTTHWFSASHGTLVDIVTVILQFCLGEVNQFSMECVFLNFKSNLIMSLQPENGLLVFTTQLCVCMQTVGKIRGVPNYDGQHMNGSFYKLSIILIFSFQ